MKMFFSDKMIEELCVELLHEQDVVQTMDNRRYQKARTEDAKFAFVLLAIRKEA